MDLIYLDNVIFDAQKSGGISVVWYELVSRLMKEDGLKIKFKDNRTLSNIFRSRLIINDEQYTIERDRLYPLSVFYPVYVKEKAPFIFHSSYYRYCSNNNAINITTVHDFTYEYYIKGLSRWKHCWQKYKAIRHSDYIICISESTKKDLMKFLPDIDEKKIRVVYNGVSEDYFETSENLCSINIPFEKKSYLVFVGSRVNYKNFELAVRSIGKTSYSLLIVGAKLSNDEQKLVNDCLPQNRWHSAGFMSNHDLNIAYNNAAALVYPSKYEGFGIPVLEAQRAGCPVIAYNGSSIPEVIGDTPLLMNELSEEELLEKMKLLSDNRLIENVITKGLENSKRFSWDKMYHDYKNLYEEAISNKRSE